MYSVKPGRGPSFGGIIGGIVAALFGIFWTIQAGAIGAPPFFCLFGVIFVLIGIGSAIVSAMNAFGKNRFSTFDITTNEEESDPFVEALGGSLKSGSKISIEDIDGSETSKGRKFEGEFCPYCGAEAGEDFNFCPKCGKDI